VYRRFHGYRLVPGRRVLGKRTARDTEPTVFVSGMAGSLPHRWDDDGCPTVTGSPKPYSQGKLFLDCEIPFLERKGVGSAGPASQKNWMG